MRIRWLAGLAALLLMALVACEDATGIVHVDRVDLGPSDQVVMVGDSVTLTAVARAANGDVVPGPILWRSLTPAIATVRASGGTGVVVAHAAGTARIEAESGGKVTQVVVQVQSAGTVGSVAVLPGTLALSVGQEVAVQAEVKSTTGEVLTGRAVVWTVEPATSAELTPQAGGWVTVRALQAGEATIRAVVEGAAGQAWLQIAEVAPPPQQVASVMIVPGDFTLPVNHETSLQAIARTAEGAAVNVPVTWSVTSTAVAEVSPIPNSAFAGFRAKSAGTVKVRATAGGVFAEITVQVTTLAPPPQQVLQLAFRAPQRGLWRGNVKSFADDLVAWGANGPIADPQVTWSVEDEAILELDAQNRVQGLQRGTTLLIATSGNVRAELRVTVFDPAVEPVFDLTFDWWDYQWHMAPQVGVEQWTDENGVEHDVSVFVTGGSLEMHDNGDYRRVLQLEGWAFVNGQGRKVVQRAETDIGQSSIMVGGESGYWMYSQTTPGLVYKVLGAPNPGHVVMRAVVGTAPELDYMFRLRQ